MRDKPEDFLAASTTQTVPVLVLQDGEVIQESRDIMLWALQRSGDPENWLAPYHADRSGTAFFDRLDGPFKSDLDRYKYAARFNRDKADIASNQLIHREQGAVFLGELNSAWRDKNACPGRRWGFWILPPPFVRQFRLADMHWFDGTGPFA